MRMIHTMLMAQRRGTKESLDEGEEGSERASLRLNIKNTKIMASIPIIAWQIEGEKVEVVTDFLFLGSKISADVDCSHEIRRQIASWQESNDKPRQHIEKQRHYFAVKGPCIAKAMVFPVVTYSCESWTIKKSEH